MRAHTVTGNLKAIAPIWRTHPYLLLGAGVVHWEFDDKLGLGIKSDETEFAGPAGVGVDVYVTRNIVLNAAIGGVITKTSFGDSFPGGELDYLFYLTAGGSVQYRF